MFGNHNINKRFESLAKDIDERFSKANFRQGEFLARRFDDLWQVMRDERSIEIQARRTLLAREFAIERALTTPGISGYVEVLVAARAYEEYLTGGSSGSPSLQQES